MFAQRYSKRFFKLIWQKFHIIILVGTFLIVCLNLFGYSFLGNSYPGISLTTDEKAHIGAGYYYLTTGRYYLNNEHPPLFKDISGLAVLLFSKAGPRFVDGADENKEYWKDGKIIEFAEIPKSIEETNYLWYETALLFNPQNNPELLIGVARFSVLIVNYLLLWIIFKKLNSLFGNLTAKLSITLICLYPTTLAFIGLVANDIMSGLTILIALLSFVSWWYSPKLRNFLGFSFWFAIALLIKYTAIILVPIILLGCLYLGVLRAGNYKVSLFKLGGAILAFALSGVIVGLYFFPHAQNMSEEETTNRFTSVHFLPQEIKDTVLALPNSGKYFTEYAVGLQTSLDRVSRGEEVNFFLGGIYGEQGAGIAYFPLLAFAKSPLIYLLLLATSISLVGGHLLSRVQKQKLSMQQFATVSTLILFVATYIFVASLSPLTIGIRHILGPILALWVVVAIVISRFWDSVFRVELKRVVQIGLIIQLFATISVFPNFIAYYNILSGGSDSGYLVASDSNYDWGQDLKLLAKWRKDNRIEQTLYLDVLNTMLGNDLEYYYDGKAVIYPGLQHAEPPPDGSYLVVSNYRWLNNVFDKSISYEKNYLSLKDKLITQLGKTLQVYKL